MTDLNAKVGEPWTDSQKNTWVLTSARDDEPWAIRRSDGSHDWATWDEAREAGLMRLWRGNCLNMMVAPAPVNPANPDDLRRWLEDLDIIAESTEILEGYDCLDMVRRKVNGVIDELDADRIMEAAEAKKLAAILGDFAVADEHTGERDDLILAQNLVRRGVRVPEEAK